MTQSQSATFASKTTTKKATKSPIVTCAMLQCTKNATEEKSWVGFPKETGSAIDALKLKIVPFILVSYNACFAQI